MNVTVRYHGQLRQAAGVGAEEVSLREGEGVQQLLRLVADRRPSLHAMLGDLDSGKPTILIFVGENQAAHDQVLTAGAEVLLLTPIAGGAPCPAGGL